MSLGQAVQLQREGVNLAEATSVSQAGRSILHAAGLGHLAADTAEA